MNNETKWQPGPWKAHSTGKARSGVPEHEIHWSDDGECVAEIVHGEPEAHLIAASPDLYAALECCVNMMEHSMEGTVNSATGKPFERGVDDLEITPDGKFKLSDARTALTRARGEQS